MRRLIGSLAIVFGYLCPNICRADVGEIRSVFEAILIAPPDDNRLPISPDLLSKMETDIRSATAEQVQSLLPLGEKCLQSTNVLVRGSGALLFTVVAIRRDGSKFLGPYIDDFAALVDDSDVGLKNGGIYFLGRANSPRALAILAAHLGDKSNSAEQAHIIAGPLVAFGDPEYLHRVLDLVQQRPDLNLKSGVIQMLGLNKITNQDTLQLIRSGLSDAEPDTRRVSLDTIDRLPKAVRVQFASELQRLTTLDEVPEIRSRALQVFSSDAP